MTMQSGSTVGQHTETAHSQTAQRVSLSIRLRPRSRSQSSAEGQAVYTHKNKKRAHCTAFEERLQTAFEAVGRKGSPPPQDGNNSFFF